MRVLMIKFRWYDLTKTSPRTVWFGWTVDGVKLNGLNGPRTWTLDIYLGKRLLVILFGGRH